MSTPETPLLSKTSLPKTPLPWLPYSIVVCLELADSLSSQVIYPFGPQLIRDLGVTHGNESQVGHYVGILQSLFFLTQAVAVVHWSALSDRVGRKPILLVGLAGLSTSMYCFGLSKTFLGVVMSRCLNGVLNGNIGVLKSVLVEITDETNITQAYAYLSIAWCTGNTLGPIIGGSLSRPAEQFPTLFGNNEFFKEYPYFLPCAIPATFAALAWPITLRFMKETVHNPQHIGRVFRAQPIPESERPLSLQSLLTSRVFIAAGNYGCLSFLDMAFRTTQPLFFSTPIELGGLGMPPSTIGKILSIYGILNGAFQILFFAKIHDYWGSKRAFRTGIASVFPAVAAFPLMNYLARAQGLSLTVWFVIAFQTMIFMGVTLSYGAIFLFVGAASPNRASLGATYGFSLVSASMMRVFGPAAANSLFSVSIEKKYLGGNLVYWVLSAAVWISVMVASLLPRKLWIPKD